MQKKLIALAVAGLISAPVFAQSNVTVYGIVDAYAGYGKTDTSGGDAKFSGVNSGGLSGSRLGFKGSEDLGNGLKAVFTLEYSLANDVNEGIGTAGLRARQQFVGLQGGFGFVGLGRQYSPGFFVYKYDAALGSSPLSPQSILSAQGGANITPNSPARVNNSINYKSPDLGGLKLNAIYGFNEVNQVDNRRKNDLLAIGADYANGPIAAGLIYSQVNDAASDKNKRELLLGGAYDFGVVKVLGSYQRLENATAAENDDNIWQIGGVVPVSGAGKVHVAYARMDADADDSDAAAWSVIYTHAMSKRTTAYVGYVQVSNDDNVKFSVPGMAIGAFGETTRGVLAGLRHVF